MKHVKASLTIVLGLTLLPLGAFAQGTDSSPGGQQGEPMTQGAHMKQGEHMKPGTHRVPKGEHKTGKHKLPPRDGQHAPQDQHHPDQPAPAGE